MLVLRLLYQQAALTPPVPPEHRLQPAVISEVSPPTALPEPGTTADDCKYVLAINPEKEASTSLCGKPLSDVSLFIQ